MLLAACKIEQTPRRYIDRRLPAAAEQEAAEDELRARLALSVQALDRGNIEAAVAALAPAPGAYVAGAGEAMQGAGAGAVFILLRGAAERAAGRFELRDLHISVEPRNNVGWFAVSMAAVPDTTGGESTEEMSASLQLSGVYLRREGAWRLVQLHLSAPPTPLIPQENPPEATDSLVPE